MAKHICSACKIPCEGCRIDNQDTAFGCAFAPVCEACYGKDCAERRAEGKRFGYRPRIVPWAKLKAAETCFHPVSE
jgi:hypothetical protein